MKRRAPPAWKFEGATGAVAIYVSVANIHSIRGGGHQLWLCSALEILCNLNRNFGLSLTSLVFSSQCMLATAPAENTPTTVILLPQLVSLQLVLNPSPACEPTELPVRTSFLLLSYFALVNPDVNLVVTTFQLRGYLHGWRLGCW